MSTHKTHGRYVTFVVKGKKERLRGISLLDVPRLGEVVEDIIEALKKEKVVAFNDVYTEIERNLDRQDHGFNYEPDTEED